MVANYASLIGLSSHQAIARTSTHHLGAALADAVLQAGVNYETVVRMRIERIQTVYPESFHMDGLKTVLLDDKISDYLLWRHKTKLTRFSHLAALIDQVGVRDTSDLKDWLHTPRSRTEMLSIHGIGPKTYDYISCLVGIDRIAVDRHLIHFMNLSGVSAKDYDTVQKITSFAADLLGVRRRDFDASIWRFVSTGKRPQNIIRQLDLPL